MLVLNLSKQYPIEEGIDLLEFLNPKSPPKTNKPILIKHDVGHSMGFYDGDNFIILIIGKDGSKYSPCNNVEGWCFLPEKYYYKSKDGDNILVDNNDYNSEKKIDSFDDLKKIVTHLEKLTFKGVTGYLDRNPAFIALKRMSLNID